MSRDRRTSLLRHPRAALKSTLLSLGHDPRRFWRLPIVASWSTRIQKGPGSALHLGGRLYLGYWRTRREAAGIGPVIRAPATLALRSGSRFVTDGVVILGPGVQTVVGPGAELRVGAGTYVSPNTLILCREAVTIGSGCAIAFGVLVMDTDFHALSVGGETTPMTAPIHIGDHVWIGAGAQILKGVTVGEGAVIGAGAVVTRDIPPRTLAAGVPARVIREGVDWE